MSEEPIKDTSEVTETVETTKVYGNTTIPESVETEVTESVEQAEVKHFLASLPDDLRKEPSLQKFETVEDALKSLVHAQKLIGKKVSEFDKEELAKYDARFGVPEALEGYDFDGPEEIKAKALKAGLDVNQAKKLAEIEIEQSKLAAEKARLDNLDKVKQFEHELSEKFGGELEGAMELARKAAMKLGGEELLNYVFSAETPADPKFIQALVNAGKSMTEHASVNVPVSSRFRVTPEEASSMIADRLRDKEFMKKVQRPYVSAEDNAELKELEHLYRIRNGK